MHLLDNGLIRPSDLGPSVREVRTACARLHARTDGYFDVRVTGRFDPSRYVRGWALQQASVHLARAGAGNHRLRIGGDIKVSGRPTQDEAWRVAVQDPCRPGEIAWIGTTTELAVATANNSVHGDRTRNPPLRVGCLHGDLGGPELGNAAAYATAAVAMGPPALDRLPSLNDHAYLAIDDHGQCFHGGGRPITLAA
ncbi:FAD:protein FMN transferase [Actinomadura sp. HBU206391]|nr:FAD:protein FMN transferase [Actinomadura sp. HBU206391]